MTARYVVTVRRDGTVHAVTEGLVGPDCLDAVPLLEDLLGATATESAYTSDFHRTSADATTRTVSTEQDRTMTRTEQA